MQCNKHFIILEMMCRLTGVFVNYLHCRYPRGSQIPYRSALELDTLPHSKGTTTVYGGGGWVVDMKRNSTREEVKDLMRTLQDLHWTDPATRAVFIDFATYNPVIKIYVATRLIVEFTVYGDLRPSFQVSGTQG